MSIIITNVSEKHGVPYGKGEQHYVLKINNHWKADFTHNFEDGLATCLRKAADAFEAQEGEDTCAKLLEWVLSKADNHDYT